METFWNFYQSFVGGRVIGYGLMAELLLWTTGTGLVLLATLVKLGWSKQYSKGQLRLMEKICHQNEEQLRVWRKVVQEKQTRPQLKNCSLDQAVGDLGNKVTEMSGRARDKKTVVRLISSEEDNGDNGPPTLRTEQVAQRKESLADKLKNSLKNDKKNERNEVKDQKKDKDLEMENLFKNGEKIMAKLKKDKSLVREVGLFNTFIILGLGYMLLRVVSTIWERVKYRFEDESEKTEEKEDETLDLPMNRRKNPQGRQWRPWG